MNKFALIILYALSITFLFQYFFPHDKTTPTSQVSDITLSVKSDSLTIPNLPHIEIINHTNSGFTLSPCQDISITVDSRPLTDIATGAPSFCSAVEVGTGKNTILSLGSLAKIIANAPGKYILTVKTPL